MFLRRQGVPELLKQGTVLCMKKLIMVLAVLVTGVAVPATIPAEAAGGDTASLAKLDTLRVEPEKRGGYRRELFPHWEKTSNGCYVRDVVLRAESQTAVASDRWGCRVLTGTWVSVYDGVTTSNPAEIEVDHVVALAEAWDSGAWSWSAAKRRAYANDLSDPRTLRAVTGKSNQAKSAKDPAEWLPRVSARCEFAADWVSIKSKWGLSVDSREKAALRNVLLGC